MLRSFIIRWLANGLGLWLATRWVPGVSYSGDIWVIVVAALIFSVINRLIKPILVILSLPAIIFSLGLFMLVINAFMLYLVTVLYPSFQVATFTAAILSVIMVWLANYAISVVLDRGGSNA